MPLLRKVFLVFTLVGAPFAAHALETGALQDVMVQCAACHGADGVARDVEIPNLAGQHDVYLYNQLRSFKSGKRPHKEMRYMGRHMSDAEMRAIAEYYAGMPKQ